LSIQKQAASHLSFLLNNTFRVTFVLALLDHFIFNNANFGVPRPIALELIVGVAALAMMIAALVAWTAVRVRPLEVLRYE